MTPRPMTSLMFCANDALKHDVTFSEHTNAWFIENERDGIIGNSYYAELPFALEQMEKLTRTKASKFTVSHNPYTHEE